MTQKTQTDQPLGKNSRVPRHVLCGAVMILCLWTAGDAQAQSAQTPAQTPNTGTAAPAPPTPGSGIARAEQGIDFRRAMRRLVEDISLYAHSLNRDFAVVTRNGLDLLVEPDPFDDTQFSLSESYVRTIDGVLIDALYFGQPKDRRLQFGAKTEPEWRDAQLDKLTKAEAGGLIGFALDFSTTPTDIDAAWRSARGEGLVSYSAPGVGIEMNRLPPWPRRPYAENGNSVRHLGDVKNYMFLRNSGVFGPQSKFASEMAGTNYDMLIVDAFHKRDEPLTRRTVDALKYKKLGSRRLVFAYLNIGEAANYRYYWQRDWAEGSPVWVSTRQRHQSDSYYVRFWDPEWNAIIFGSRTSYLYGLIRDLGFDGVLLDGVEAYRYFEGSLED